MDLLTAARIGHPHLAQSVVSRSWPPMHTEHSHWTGSCVVDLPDTAPRTLAWSP